MTDTTTEISIAHDLDLDIVKAAWGTPNVGADGRLIWGLHLALKGPPGIGKTSRLCGLARQLGFEPYPILGARMDRTDLGVPIPYEHEGELWTRPSLPDWVRLSRQKPMVVIWDEINAGTSQAFLAALLDVIQSHQLGTAHLGQHTRIVAAYNPPKWATGGMTLPASSANRFTHVPLWMGANEKAQIPEGARDSWAQWFTEADDTLQTELSVWDVDRERVPVWEQEILEKWPTAHGNARALVAAFVRTASLPEGHSGDLFFDPPTNQSDPRSGGGWASPRTCDYAARILATAQIHKLSLDQEKILLAGTVGDAWARVFQIYRDGMELPSPEDFLLKGGWQTFDFTERPDKTFVVLSTAVRLLTGVKERSDQLDILPEMYGALLRCAETASADLIQPAYNALGGKHLRTNIPGEDKTNPKSAWAQSMEFSAKPVIKEFLDALREARQ